MSAHIRAFGAAGGPAVTQPFRRELGVLAGLVLLLAGCADTPRSLAAGPDPADPRACAPRVDYHSTVGAYKGQRPVVQFIDPHKCRVNDRRRRAVLRSALLKSLLKSLRFSRVGYFSSIGCVASFS